MMTSVLVMVLREIFIIILILWTKQGYAKVIESGEGKVVKITVA